MEDGLPMMVKPMLCQCIMQEIVGARVILQSYGVSVLLAMALPSGKDMDGGTISGISHSTIFRWMPGGNFICNHQYIPFYVGILWEKIICLPFDGVSA